MEATGSSHLTENHSPPTSEDDSPGAAHFWPNGNSGETEANSLAHNLSRVTLSQNGHSASFTSPNSSAISSASSSENYWLGNEESAFGSKYSSDSGSPQSPLIRTSRPITGGSGGGVYKQQPMQSAASPFYQQNSKVDKSMSVWPPKSQNAYFSSAPFSSAPANAKSVLQASKDRIVDWGKNDRMAPGQPFAPSSHYGPFVSHSARASASRPGGQTLSSRPQPSQAPPSQQAPQDMAWSLGSASWGQTPVTFHARKFARRRGNRTLTSILHLINQPVHN